MGTATNFKRIHSFKTVCITGGAGSLGSELVRILLQSSTAIVRVLDNSEGNLGRLRSRFIVQESRLRWFHKDIRDLYEIKRAVEGVDLVIHAAALKHIWLGQYNPKSVKSVNVDGTQNVIDACMDERNVQVCISVSTDKAVNPTSFYGQSKAMAEGLVLNANRMKGDRPTAFSVYRPCNFFLSSGNVVEKWRDQIEAGASITLTRGDMRRYYIGTGRAAELLLKAAMSAEGGDIWIPKAKEYSISELAELFGGEIQIVNGEEGEKRREELYTEEEVKFMRDEGDMWCIRRPTL